MIRAVSMMLGLGDIGENPINSDKDIGNKDKGTEEEILQKDEMENGKCGSINEVKQIPVRLIIDNPEVMNLDKENYEFLQNLAKNDIVLNVIENLNQIVRIVQKFVISTLSSLISEVKATQLREKLGIMFLKSTKKIDHLCLRKRIKSTNRSTLIWADICLLITLNEENITDYSKIEDKIAEQLFTVLKHTINNSLVSKTKVNEANVEKVNEANVENEKVNKRKLTPNKDDAKRLKERSDVNDDSEWEDSEEIDEKETSGMEESNEEMIKTIVEFEKFKEDYNTNMNSLVVLKLEFNDLKIQNENLVQTNKILNQTIILQNEKLNDHDVKLNKILDFLSKEKSQEQNKNNFSLETSEVLTNEIEMIDGDGMITVPASQRNEIGENINNSNNENIQSYSQIVTNQQGSRETKRIDINNFRPIQNQNNTRNRNNNNFSRNRIIGNNNFNKNQNSYYRKSSKTRLYQ